MDQARLPLVASFSTFVKHLPIFLLITYWVLMFVGTHIPINTSLPFLGFPQADKLVHMMAFMGLAMLLIWTMSCFRQVSNPVLWITLVTLVGYSVFDEWSQRFVPGRHSHVFDWIADLVGIVAGSSAAVLVQRWLDRE